MPHVMINGCKLYYEEHGTGQQTVIFLHDLFFNARMFNQQMIALRNRFHCVLVDFRGHGNSVVSSGGFQLETMAHDIRQLIEVKRWGACHMVGCGMGGYVAVLSALQTPQLVSSLTVIGSSVEDLPIEQVRWLKTRALQIKLFGMRLSTNKILRRSFSNGYLINTAHRQQITHWKNELLALDRRQVVQSMSGFWTRPRLSDSLYKIKTPALIIAAELDSVTSMVSIKRTHNAVRGAKFVSLPGTGHIANLEKPKMVSEALLSFFHAA